MWKLNVNYMYFENLTLISKKLQQIVISMAFTPLFCFYIITYYYVFSIIIMLLVLMLNKESTSKLLICEYNI